MSTQSLTAVASRLLEVLEAAPNNTKVKSPWAHLLTSLFDESPSDLPVVGVEYLAYQHPCVQVAIEHYLSEISCPIELVGTGSERYRRDSFGELLENSNAQDEQSTGPVAYRSIHLHEDKSISCVTRGLYLIADKQKPLAIGIVENGYNGNISIQVMAIQRAIAEEFLKRLDTLINELSVYKGHILSLVSEPGFGLKFHSLEPLAEGSLVLPVDLLETIERQTVNFIEHKDAIRAAGLPVKRGILLHGAPGCGKSLTIRYLLNRLGERTTILVHGYGLREITKVCDLARILQPSTVVIEDVDLVAEDRRTSCTNPSLVELLNEMDGLRNDADILFVLTTNRAEVLEPALKSRPGRVDQAIEIPLPDEDCRRRLFELYTKGLCTKVENLHRLVKETKGCSPAFIRELTRRAALSMILEGPGSQLREAHLIAALNDIQADGGAMTRSLMGFQPSLVS